ncbi:MAG: MFS transporter [Simkaniaceae bacterium]|nr:MFS transporter [Candidatus Sacchlamyda saccharinae]
MTPEKRRSFFSLLFVSAMDNFGLGVVFVMFAPLLLSPDYHFVPVDTSVAVRNFYLAILFIAFPLTQIFGAPILGDLADRIGRKKALYISIIGVIAGTLLSGIGCLFYSIWILLFSRLFTGFFAGNLSICLSAIADLSPTEKSRSRNFGILTVIWGISWNIAMLVGGYLSDPSKSSFFSPALPFWLTAILTLLSLFAIAKFYTETHVSKDNHPFNLVKGLHNIILSLKIKETRLYFLVILLWTLGWGLSVQWFAAYSILKYQALQTEISWGLVIQGCFWMLGGSVLNPILLKRYNSHKIAIIAYSFLTIVLAATLLATNYWVFCAIYWIAAVFSSFGFSNSMNLASIHAPDDVQGKVMGLSQSMMSLGFVIVPIIGGVVGGLDATWFYPISAALILINVLLLFINKEKKAYTHE